MGLISNTDTIPKRLPDGKGKIMVDQAMAIKGSENIYAVGDVIGRQRCGWLITDAQTKHLVEGLDGIFRGNVPLLNWTSLLKMIVSFFWC